MPPDDARTAVVVGAGVGGLAAAVGLRRSGWRVTVLERSPVLAELGAGLSLWSNALHALDALGLPDVRRSGVLQAAGGLRTWRGRYLARGSGRRLAEQTGVTVLVVHRVELQQRLRSALPEDAVVLGARVTGLRQDDQAVRVRADTPDGPREVTAALVVGADGLGSAVRGLVGLDARAVPVGFTAWRGVTTGALSPVPEPGVLWGRGSEFGVVPLADGRIYWFGTANLPPGTRFPDEAAEVRRRFGSWSDPVPAVLGATAPQDVLHHDVLELRPPLPSYAVGRVALLGDASHAMTPNLGQGACLALEDAVELAARLPAGADVPTGLRAYDAARRPRTQRLARASRRAGRVIQQERALACAVRDAAVRLLPERLLLAGIARTADWRPPPLG